MTDHVMSVSVRGDMGNLAAVMAGAAATVRTFGADVNQIGSSVKSTMLGVSQELRGTLGNSDWVDKNEKNLTRAGTAIAGFGAVVIGGLALAANAAIGWESAWAGVVKTTDATAAELPALEEGLRSLTGILPATHGEIAAVAEAAGQLGIRSGDVVEFTRVMIDLGESTNVTSDAAATAIAQISNVMGEGFPISEVENFGSALVELGNNGASTEAQILDIAQRIAGGAGVIGLSVQEMLGFANAIASVGIRAEVGGSSLSRVMAGMAQSVALAGDKLDILAEVSGISAQEFANQFNTAPAQAIDGFLRGLNRMNEEGGNTFGTLKDLGFQAVGTSQLLLSLAGAGELLADSLAMSEEAWATNSALAEEAGKRYETTESRIAIARNQLNDFAIDVGSNVLPMLANLADGAANLFDALGNIPGPVLSVLTALGGIAGAAALVAGGLLILIPRLHQTKVAFDALAAPSGMPRTAGVMRGFAKAAGIAGLVLALGSVVTAATATEVSVERMTNVLAGVGSGSQGVDLRNLFPELHESWFDDVETFSRSIRNIQSDLQMAPATFFEGIGLGFVVANEGLVQMRDGLKAVGTSLAQTAASDLPLAQRQFAALADATDGADATLMALLETMPEYRDALYGVATQMGAENVTETQLLALATGDLAAAGLSAAQATQVQEAALASVAEAAGMTTEQYEAAVEAHQAWKDMLSSSMAGFIDVNGTLLATLDEGEDAWSSYKDGVSTTLAELNALLSSQIAEQENWARNLTDLSSVLTRSTLDYLIGLGAEGAPLVQQAWEELQAGNMAGLEELDANIQRQLETTYDGWSDTQARKFTLMALLGEKYGTDMAQAIADGIDNGQFTVDEALAALGITLDEFGGVVEIDADTLPAELSVEDLLALVENLDPGNVRVGADLGLADTALEDWRNGITGADPAQAPMDANTDPATATATAWRQVESGLLVEVPVDAFTDPATGTTMQWRQVEEGHWAAIPVDAWTDPATGETLAWRRQENGRWAVVPVDANTGEALATVGGTRTFINRTGADIPVGAKTGPARGSVGALIGWIERQWATITVTTVGKSLAGGIPKGNAYGGVIPGTPSDVDNVLWPMATGEYVVRASQVARYLPLLEQINAGILPSNYAPVGRANGGMITSNGGAWNTTIVQAPSMPDTMTLVDADGTFLGRMRVVAGETLAVETSGLRRASRQLNGAR